MLKLSGATFFAAIRVVLWQFLYLSRELGELSPEYLDCPVFCGNDEETVYGYCETCPRAELKDDFKTSCVELLEERAPGWEKWGFDELYDQAIAVFDLEQIPEEKRTITTAGLIEILSSEREKMKLIDEYNREQERKNKT